MACGHPDAKKPVNCGWRCHWGCAYELPEGWMLNPKDHIVAKILKALDRTGGDCPCVPETEWNDATRCPCLKFRSGEGCHCGLYVQSTEGK